jgi:hypothetical protein
MPSYIPEYVYGTIPGTYGEMGLVPWPKHLQPREASGVELTKKGEAYCAANAPLPDIDLFELFGEEPKTVSDLPALAEARGVFFLTLTRDRASIATTIERLIGMLDDMDPDPDLEDNGDLEPNIGWVSGDRPARAFHDCEERELDGSDDEDGADDEPTMGWSNDHHGGGDQTKIAEGCDASTDECEEELEPTMGWPENDGQGPVIAGRNDPNVQCLDAVQDNEELGRLDFRGVGNWEARKALRAAKPRRKPNPTHGEIAHRLPDGTIMRTFVASTDSRAPELRAEDFNRLPFA